MRAVDLPGWFRDTALRLLPHATTPGLRSIGQPGPDSPVLVTGNFRLTVRRLVQALEGRDVWLLVTNSNGINVWCAAGGGHLTHHDVITAIRSSRLGDKIEHRELVLPQLAATGIERRKITDATGWEASWGPARLEDLPEVLDRGLRIAKRHRTMEFPLWERLEMALMWLIPLVILTLTVLGLTNGWRLGLVAGGAVALAVLGAFAGLPWLRISGRARWLTFAGFALCAWVVGVGLLVACDDASTTNLLALAIAATLAMLILSVDIAGSTPWYPGSLNTWGNQYSLELVADRCTGAADCVAVCPRDVLRMDGRRRQVELAHLDACVLCGACIVQCPEDALRFRFDDGRVVEPETVRRTRLNMLGRRSVSV